MADVYPHSTLGCEDVDRALIWLGRQEKLSLDLTKIKLIRARRYDEEVEVTRNRLHIRGSAATLLVEVHNSIPILEHRKLRWTVWEPIATNYQRPNATTTTSG